MRNQKRVVVKKNEDMVVSDTNNKEKLRRHLYRILNQNPILDY